MTHPFLDALVAEHRAIDRVLGALARAIEAGAIAVQRRQVFPAEVFVAAASFFRDFADAVHHEKEEKGLFAAMIGVGAASNRGPVACMVRGHDVGRNLVEHMEAALGALGREPWRERELLTASALYHEFLSDHIAREDAFIYPLAAATVSVAMFDELERLYCDDGGAAAGAMLGAAERIEALAPAPSTAAGPRRDESPP